MLNGNRTTGGVLTIAGNRLAEDLDYRYAYDNQGNLIRREAKASTKVREFAYDHRNRLVAVADRDSAAGPVTKAATYTYDAFDRRVAKALDPDGTGPATPVRSFTAYDGVEVLADLDATGTVTRRYLHGPAVDQVLARLDGSGAVDWYLADRLGSVRALARIGAAAATVLDRIDYDAFGNTVAETVPANGDRFGFTARELDPETGLYYYRARYYDPATGRFLAQDPAGFAAGDPNLYRYVGNSPTNYTDPSGLQAQPSTGGGVIDPNQSPAAYETAMRGQTDRNTTMNELQYREYMHLGKDAPIRRTTQTVPPEDWDYGSTYLQDVGQIFGGAAIGIGKSAHDLVAAPYDSLRIGVDAGMMYFLGWDTGHQEASYFGEAAREAVQAGAETAAVGSEAVASFLTFGLIGLGKSAARYLQGEGDAGEVGEALGGSAFAFATAAVVRSALAKFGAKPTAASEPARFAVDGQGLVTDRLASSKPLPQPRTLFRGERSSRTSAKVFEEGLPPKGGNTDLHRHVSGTRPDTNFVATSIRPGIAKGFAGKNGWLYVNRSANGVDVNAVLGPKAPFPEQFEFAVPGGLRPGEVMGAFRMKNGKIAGPFVRNPNFGK